jgi:hypothetical protein
VKWVSSIILICLSSKHSIFLFSCFIETFSVFSAVDRIFTFIQISSVKGMCDGKNLTFNKCVMLFTQHTNNIYENFIFLFNIENLCLTFCLLIFLLTLCLSISLSFIFFLSFFYHLFFSFSCDMLLILSSISKTSRWHQTTTNKTTITSSSSSSSMS